MRKTVAVSGFFDPFHVGHLDYLEAAHEIGDVIVILNSDAAAERKKKYCFMPFEQRKRILEALSCVSKVVPVDDSDGTVCEALIRIKPDAFAKGGDRTPHNTPEQEVCGWLGIELIWEVGGGKTQASSTLVRNAANKLVEDAIFSQPTECLYEDKT